VAADTHRGRKRPTVPAAHPAARVARSAGLIYVTDSDPGFGRRRRGRGFCYVRPDGRPLRSPAHLRRIASLAIPPAYERVWICMLPRGHLQATGRDARGRKQYRYHPRWRETRDDGKFERLVDFGAALPKLRRRLRADLALSGLPRAKVLAMLVKLLDTTCARIGNAEYARDNNSFGLTTLRDRHVRPAANGAVRLRFRGKGGLEHDIVVDDPRLARLVRRCQELPGQQLFQYLDEADQRCSVTSTMVNEYLRETMGADFTAKDFRTWAATLRALERLAATPLPDPPSPAALRRAGNEIVRQVAEELRNTPAVCRRSYICPLVFEIWSAGRLTGPLPSDPRRRVLQLLRQAFRKPRRHRVAMRDLQKQASL
jgi:DNA topoisomerase IB